MFLPKFRHRVRSWQDADSNFQLLYRLLTGRLGAENILDGGVEGEQIAELSIGSAHIQEASIGSAHIQEASIQTAHIDDLAVTDAKIESLSADKITAGELAADVIYSGDIYADQIVSGTLASSVVYAGDILADQISGGTISGVTINVDTVMYIGHSLVVRSDLFDASIEFRSADNNRLYGEIYTDPSTRTLFVTGYNATHIGSYGDPVYISGDVEFIGSVTGISLSVSVGSHTGGSHNHGIGSDEYVQVYNSSGQPTRLVKWFPYGGFTHSHTASVED